MALSIVSLVTLEVSGFPPNKNFLKHPLCQYVNNQNQLYPKPSSLITTMIDYFEPKFCSRDGRRDFNSAPSQSLATWQLFKQC